jgi:hypothetical protein
VGSCSSVGFEASGVHLGDTAMSIPLSDYVDQLAVVGNARLRGVDARSALLDDPFAMADVRGPDVFRGFELDGGFEPSPFSWLDTLRARGAVALRVLTQVDPADWILVSPPPVQRRLPAFCLSFADRDVWYDHRMERLTPEERFSAIANTFVAVEESRRIAIPTVDAAERELAATLRAYLKFLEGKVPRDDTTAVFYETRGREALEWLTTSESQFLERLRARREQTLRERRKDFKQRLGRPYTKEQRPQVLERAAKSVRLDDLTLVMEEAGLSWKTQRLGLVVSLGLQPLNMRHERTSEEQLPAYVLHPGYVAVGSPLSLAIRDAWNASLNASA